MSSRAEPRRWPMHIGRHALGATDLQRVSHACSSLAVILPTTDGPLILNMRLKTAVKAPGSRLSPSPMGMLLNHTESFRISARLSLIQEVR